MKSLLFALLCSAVSLASATTAAAQTAPPAAPKGVTVQYSSATYQGCPVSAELNKYEIRRFLAIGAITAQQAHEIRARKRAATRSENKYLKAQVAKWVDPEVSSATGLKIQGY